MANLENKSTTLRARLLQSGKATPVTVATRNAAALPRVIRGSGAHSLSQWVRDNAHELQEFLHTSGGVLFRGFPVASVATFREVCVNCIDGLMPYNERSTPREQKGDRVYTSTEYPSDQAIALHNEFSYALAWPMRICFYALVPPEEGGETPIADGRRVYDRIAAEIRDRFVSKGVMYVRRYGWGVDLSWQEAFGTSDPQGVERYCRDNQIQFEWEGPKLTTRQVRAAVTRHPVTGEMVWFNQAHLFHPTNLPADVYRSMQKIMDGHLPREALYGDGTPIETEELREVRAAFEAVKVVFPWEKHDVLLLDNVLINHGRSPYRGPRTILVAMGQPSAGELA
jgi:alpha-ketoglutarate-dependent taurine dioxygenase